VSIKNFLKHLIFYFFLSVINLFSVLKIKPNPKKYHIIVDGILSKTEGERWLKLSKYFKSVCIVGNSNFSLRAKKTDFFTYGKFFLLFENNLTFFIKFKILLLVIEIFIYSIINQKNYFLLFNNILYKFLKYKFIFAKLNAEFMIEEKFYATSELKNYLFKSSGGLKSACIQKNMLELSISSFITTDIFFSLGNNTANILKKLGGKAKKIYPVGSLFMEERWFKKKKDLKKVENIDLLIVGINAKNNFERFDINRKFRETYYEYIQWVKKFSKKFPKKKVVLKHHGNYINFSMDEKEMNILKDSKIKVILDEPSNNKSYGLAFKSKILCSFGSTMIMEYLGLGKKSYFIDPKFGNQQFFDYLPQVDKWRISTYEEFEKIILSNLKKKRYSFSISKQKNPYCVDSSNVSKKIFKYLTKT